MKNMKQILSILIFTLTSTFILKAQNVSTFAGSGGAGSNDGLGVLANFNGPYGTCIDASGNIYIADTYNHKIRKISSIGLVTTVAGSGTLGSVDGTGSNASFASPTSICIDQIGNLYVGDITAPKIRKINTSGVVSTLAGSGIAGSADGLGALASFNSIGGLCVDASNNLYVADGANKKIRKVSPSGSVTTLAGNSGPASYIDGVGSGAGFTYPSGICISASGDLFVADGNKIRKVTPSGTVTTIAGTSSVGSVDGQSNLASFNNPNGLCIDVSNNLYIADSYNDLIRKIDPSGMVTTIAGSGTSGSVDALGLLASFNRPFDISIDAFGNLYIADFNNNKIRKIDFNITNIFMIKQKQQLLIYPNPAQNYIAFNSDVKINSIKISDMFGRIVLISDSSENPINISSLEKGIYFIELNSTNSMVKQKIIKN